MIPSNSTVFIFASAISLVVVLFLLIFAGPAAALLIGIQAFIVTVISLLILAILLRANQPGAEGAAATAASSRAVWFVIGAVVALLVSSQLPIRLGDRTVNRDTGGVTRDPGAQERFLASEFLLPETFTVPANQAGGLAAGASSCVPVLEETGQWRDDQMGGLPRVIVRDETGRVLSLLSAGEPRFDRLISETTIQCSYPIQVQTTVAGDFLQFEVNGRVADVLPIGPIPLSGQPAPVSPTQRELRPLAPGDGRPGTADPLGSAPPSASRQ